MLSPKKKKFSICKECKKASTPAINAARLGHTECLVTAYRELGVFNERDNFGATPIHFAARNGKLDCLKWLVERSGVSPNAVTMNGNTAAHDAAATGHVECLEYLIFSTRCSIKDTNSEGATVLHVACRFGQKEVVQWLVEKAGCPLNSKGANDVTAVHLCAAKNHLGCLKWLTSHQDYSPNEKTVHGATPVYFAAQEGSLECLQWLIEQGKGHAYQTALDGMAPIHAAAQAGQKICLEYMVKGASVSVRSRADDGATPAHFAAASGQVECLEWILDNGGSVLDRDNLGGTPVHDAAEQGQVKALAYMMERGIDVNTRDNEGLKPVDLAKENNHEEAYQLLFRVARPKLLSSMEPDHSLSRAAGLTEEQKEIMRAEEKQKFEAMAGSISAPKKDQKMQLEDMDAQSAQDSLEATSPVSDSSEHGYSHAMDRQRRRSSAGVRKSLDIQKESSPDVEDINAAILKTMETHLLDTDTDKGVILHKKKPVSPYLEKSGRQQPLQKKSFFSFFSSPPKGDKKPVKKMKHGVAQVDAEVENSAPHVPLESPPMHKGAEVSRQVVPASKTTKAAARPTSPVARKVVKKRVVKKPKSPKPKQGLPQEDVRGDTEVKKVEMKEQEPSSPSRKALQVDVQVELRTPEPAPAEEVQESTSPVVSEPSSPLPMESAQDQPQKEPSSPLPMESAQDQPQKLIPLVISNPKPVPVRKISKSKTPEMSEQPTSPKALGISQPKQLHSPVKPKESSSKKGRAAKPGPIQIETPMKLHRYSVEQKSPTSDSGQLSPISGATPKRPIAQKRQVKRRPVSNPPKSRGVSSSSAVRQPSSPRKRPPSAKTRRPVSAGAERRDSGVVHSVSNIGFKKEDNEHPTQKAEEVGEIMANDLVQGVLADLTNDSTSTSETKQLKTAETVAEDLVQEVLKEAISIADTKQSSDTSHDNAPFIPKPPPPPPLPLLSPPSPPYVFTIEKRPQKETTEKILNQEKNEQTSQENLAPEEKGVEMTDESFIISFVTGRPEDREMDEGCSSSTVSLTKEQAKDAKPKEKVLSHKEKLELEQAMLQRKRESVRSSWEEKWIYRGPLDSALYSKIHEFQKQRVERGYTDVLKKADDYQAPSSTTSISESDTDEEETPEVVQGGRLSDRLKMFGGAASFVKTTPLKEEEEKKKQKKVKKVKKADKAEENAALTEQFVPQMEDVTVMKDIEADSRLVESALPKHLDGDVSDSKLMLRGSSPRRRSSSCVSITAFATIEEEGQGSMVESTESLDKVTPLPKIGPSLSRRQSAELLRLDGMLKKDSEGEEREGASDTRIPASSSKGLEKKDSVPSVDAKAIYMNSANLPYINKQRDKCEHRELDRVKGIINGLISEPRSTGYMKLKFQGLNPDDSPKVQIWQYNDKTIQLVRSIKVVDFGPSEIYMFFEVKQNGPLLFHIYVWLGLSISRQRLDGVYEHVQNLVHCVPGKAIIHREFYGYESLEFHQMLGEEGVKQLSSHHTSTTSYLNPELSQAMLMTYTNGDFKRVDPENCNYAYVSSSRNPLVLNSPTGLYLWLPISYWVEQLKRRPEAVLKISEKFISLHSLPKWTPVVAMTQDAEVSSFCDHFPDWVMSNLGATHESHKLRLPSLKPPKITYPVTGQLKVWTIVNNELRATGMADLGHFYSDQVHVVHYSYPKQSTLYTWMEGVVYIWLGSAVKTDRDMILKEVGEKLPAVMTTSNLPTVIVPEGLEPPELLYLFKGKFIIQKNSNPQGSRLYKLSGNNAMSIKTEEVPVHASSLHSFHTFCLVLDGSPCCVWAGQFAEKTLRRAALVVVKTVSKSKQILVMSEGLEIKDFWHNLGGTGKYDRYSPVPGVDYISPRLYSTNLTHRSITFTELNATKREELDSKTCYVLFYRSQILVRVGKEVDKRLVPTEIVKSYILQHNSFKTDNNFVVTVVHEGVEGEIFWKWFSFQDSNLQETSNSQNKVFDEPEMDKNLTSDSGEVQAISNPDDLQLPKEVASLVEPSTEESSAEKAKFLEQMANETTDELNTIISDILGSTGNLMSSSSTVIATTPEITTSKSNTVVATTPEVATAKSNTVVATTPEVTTATSNTEETLPEAVQDNATESTVKSEEATAIEKTTEQENEPTKKVQQPLAKKKKPTSATPVVDLAVYIPEIDKTVQIRVKETANILSVIFKAAEAGNVKIKEYYALFEAFEALKLQRALEDHEVIKNVMALWPKEEVSRTILVLKIFPTKNQLWTKSTPIPKDSITAWTKEGVPPDVGMKLHCLKRGLTKEKWVQERYVMVKSGMAHEEQGAKKTVLTVTCGLDYSLYVPFNEHGKDWPTPFCFVMKPPNHWKEKDMKIFCTPDTKTLSQWIQAVRLMKHGLQLKGNYLAMKKRVDAIRAKELLKESTTLSQP